MTVTVEFPMKLPNPTNLREHWAVKAKRVKAQRKATFLELRYGLGPRSCRQDLAPSERYVVTLTRISPRKLDDDGNVAAFKAVRDEVAAHFGVDDADPRISWRYSQAKGPCAVRLEFDLEAR